MIQQQLIEKIRRKFPDRLEVEIRGSLNEVKDAFCKETKILEGWFTEFNTTATDIYYDLQSDVVFIKQVILAGANIDPLGGVYGRDPSNVARTGWWLKGDQIGIGYIDKTEERALGAVQAVQYFGVKLAADFTTDLSEESEIPSDYHRALLAGVLEEYHADRGDADRQDLKWALYWQEELAQYRRRAKREANTRQDGTPYKVFSEGY